MHRLLPVAVTAAPSLAWSISIKGLISLLGLLGGGDRGGLPWFVAGTHSELFGSV